MTCSATAPLSLEERLVRLARDVHRRHRCFIREFRIEPAAGGLVLHGRAYCFYGKQLAQEELRQHGLRILCNRILVDGSIDDACDLAGCACGSRESATGGDGQLT
jgi:hypothetical protein